jgi:two-component system phosphate regulon sensor histidine kinase PhoR
MKINHSSTLSLLASGIISVFVFFLFLIIALFNSELLRIQLLVFIPFFTFIFSFIIIKYFAEQYLYNKLKVIYKIINKQLKEIDLIQAEQDIAEWMQDRNIQLADYQKQMKFRKEFLGNVSHELKTPLTSIQAYIETLQHTNLNEEKRFEYLQKAMKNTMRLNEIVSDLQQIHDLETRRNWIKVSKISNLRIDSRIN